MTLSYTTTCILADKSKSERLKEKSRYKNIFSLYSHTYTGNKAVSKLIDPNNECFNEHTIP